MAFIDQENLLCNYSFQVKVRQAMTKTALSVVGETPSANATRDSKRHDLAVAVIRNVETHEKAFLRAVAANATITANSTDSDVEFTVSSVWNDLAGVTGAESA